MSEITPIHFQTVRMRDKVFRDIKDKMSVILSREVEICISNHVYMKIVVVVSEQVYPVEDMMVKSSTNMTLKSRNFERVYDE